MNLFVYNNNTLIFSQGSKKSKTSLLTLRTHPLQLSTSVVRWQILRDLEMLVWLWCGSLVSGGKQGHKTCALGSCYFWDPKIQECWARNKSIRFLSEFGSISICLGLELRYVTSISWTDPPSPWNTNNTCVEAERPAVQLAPDKSDAITNFFVTSHKHI